MRQRWAIPGLAILAALAFGATACTSSPAATPTAGPTRSGIDVLTAAAAKTKGQSYQFSLTYGAMLTGDGSSSGTGTATSLKVTFTDPATGVVVKVEALVLTTGAYAKIDLGPAAGAVLGISPTTWVHIDPTKAPGAARLGIAPGKDIFGPDTYLKGVQTATADSDTQVSGTLDLGKSAPPGLALALIPAAQQVVPFTATLDDQGRISKIEVKVPAVGTAGPAASLTTTYSSWGVAVSATAPPASQTVEAPALVYSFLQ